jgi:predicted DNA-binding protein (MmcQ/YjbR family)
VAGKRGPSTIRDRIKVFALSLPGAYEDHPWGEDVAKVNNKIFVFLGHEGSSDPPGMSVKLSDSHGQALMIPGAEPTGYGLARGGWVSVPLTRKAPPLDVLRDWVEESYGAVAPKELVAELEAQR